jgi:hypothetical protein
LPFTFLLQKVVLNPIVLLVVALLSGVVGVALLYDVPAYAARAARAERLEPISAAMLADSAPGREVLLEGQVSHHTLNVYRSFVAYVREEYRSELSLIGGDTSQRWEEVERVTPPLLVALVDGEARIANDDYELDTTAFTFREAEPTLTDGAVQSRGYRVGDPALVVGMVVDAGGERAVEAEFIYAGTRAAYLAEMRTLTRRSLPIGGAFLLVCAASTVALVWQVRRVLREIAAEQAADEVRADQESTRSRPRKKLVARRPK